LGLKRSLPSGLALTDVTASMGAFERINRCSIEITIATTSPGSTTRLTVNVRALDEDPALAVPVVLASVQMHSTQEHWASLEAVILSALYRLDAVMAEDEFAKLKNKDA